PAVVLLLDMDHFKEVNDEHGHLVGDDVLRAVGQSLRGTVRDFDTVGRFGGEEFVAWLPRAGRDDGVAVAERLRAAIARIDVPNMSGWLSVSIGLACFPEHGTTVEELLKAADTALYRAKNAGRNRVTVAAGPTG
ncbi:MAG: GGDEF domain-containing protein, partial [Actinomycetia bacterium]|nr:GGDEF domain-containing protein [Actinomycetes bacterium]